MTLRILTAVTLSSALFLSAPVWAADETAEKSQSPVVERTVDSQQTVQARTEAPKQGGPTLHRVGARTDGFFPYAYPHAGPPQVLPMLPVSLVAGSGLGF